MIPFLDLGRVHEPLAEELTAAFQRVLAHGGFINGPEVAALEGAFAAEVGVQHAIGSSSGTDALLGLLMAMGVGPGDRVVVPTFTFFATAGCVSRLGATPIFVDVDPDTLLMDTAQAVSHAHEARIAIPVHLFGQCVDVQPLIDAGFEVIEDAAQSHGAQNGVGVTCGGQARAACFSFFPTKPLGGFGDGGLITTDDPALADRVRLTGRHGARPKYHHHVVGGNFRLDTLQAALLSVKLPYMRAWSLERAHLAERYDTGLGDNGAVRPLARAPGSHVFHQYVIRASRRDELRAALAQQGIGSMVYYPQPLHRQVCFEGGGGLPDGALPHSEEASREVLALPCFPGLTIAEQDTVIAAVRAFYAG